MNEEAVKLKLNKVTQGLSEALKGTTTNSEKFEEYQRQMGDTWKETEQRIHIVEKITSALIA